MHIKVVLSSCLLTAVGVLVPAPIAAGQETGAALCASALAAADAGASTYAGYALVRAPQSGGSGSQIVLGTAVNDRVSGGSGDDVVCGFGGADILRGGTGNDIVVGGPGADQLFGESGDDTLYRDPSDRVVNGGSGTDTVIDEPQATPTVTRSFRLADEFLEVCFVDVQLSGFAPGSTVEAVTFVALDASGNGSTYNNEYAVLIGADGTGAFTDATSNTALRDGSYHQVQVDGYVSPWVLMDCL